jgi:hypothetical protein
VEPPVDPSTGDALMYPADAWEMNYFADGVVGGMFRFEIDATAFTLWSIVAHAGWATDPDGHLRRHWETITRGLELLVRWRDPATGLHAPAQEDDQATFSQTLHGAITVFGALDIGARAARLLGEDAAAERWEHRAAELRDAIETHFYDPSAQTFFMTDSDRLPMMASGLTPTGPTAWMIWPCTMMDFGDPRVDRQLARDYGIIEPVVNLTPPGGLYFMKSTIPLAVAGGDEWRDVIAALPETLAHHATEATDHFGEVMVVLDDEGAPHADQRVATPHLWEGTLFALTAMAAEDPRALRAYDDVLPPSRVIDPVAADDSGCDCASAPGRPGAPVAPLLALLLATLPRLGCRRRF